MKTIDRVELTVRALLLTDLKRLNGPKPSGLTEEEWSADLLWHYDNQPASMNDYDYEYDNDYDLI